MSHLLQNRNLKVVSIQHTEDRLAHTNMNGMLLVVEVVILYGQNIMTNRLKNVHKFAIAC